jgi:hypothetical protein
MRCGKVELFFQRSNAASTADRSKVTLKFDY